MKTKYLYVLLFLFSFSSCSDDLLYQEPSTSLTDESVLESAENVKAVLMGAYSWTGHYHYLTIGQISLDVMGNDLKISNGNYHYSTYNWLMYSYAYQQYPRKFDGLWSAYSPYMWEKAYKAIDECNQIIVNADKLPEGCDDLLAQAYGIRGWNFLNLYHLYCASYTSAGPSGQGLFLRLTPADASGDNAPRSDLATSMKRIIDDFTYVYENSTGTDTYFMNKRAAALLLARTYLDMGEYDNARMYAEAIGSPFDGSDLMTKEEYQSGFNTINSEWLWGFNFTSETTNIYASIPSFYQVATAKDKDSGYGTPGYGTQVDYDYLLKNGVDYLVGYGTVRVAKSFVDIFEDNDCRKLFPFYLDSKDGYITSKFTSKVSLGIADYPMCRLAEAYLIEAECLLKGSQPDVVKGLQILNALRVKRGESQLTSAQFTSDEIWKERRRELYGEGFALSDIKRLQKPLERVGEEHWSDVITLPANSPRMMFPIPADELDYNKSATSDDQNEYWR